MTTAVILMVLAAQHASFGRASAAQTPPQRRAQSGAEDWRWRWQVWLPDKWQRIGACETGYGKRPGNWRWNSGTYQGAFGFHYTSWDRFRRPQDPHEAYQATPWAQYQVALRIWRRYGFSGWGCKNA